MSQVVSLKSTRKVLYNQHWNIEMTDVNKLTNINHIKIRKLTESWLHHLQDIGHLETANVSCKTAAAVKKTKQNKTKNGFFLGASSAQLFRDMVISPWKSSAAEKEYKRSCHCVSSSPFFLL